jgi:hypothetical protein
VFFDRKYSIGSTNPVDKIDRARRKASRNSLAAVATRRLEPACLSEKVGFDFFSIGYIVTVKAANPDKIHIEVYIKCFSILFDAKVLCPASVKSIPSTFRTTNA